MLAEIVLDRPEQSRRTDKKPQRKTSKDCQPVCTIAPNHLFFFMARRKCFADQYTYIHPNLVTKHEDHIFVLLYFEIVRGAGYKENKVMILNPTIHNHKKNYDTSCVSLCCHTATYKQNIDRLLQIGLKWMSMVEKHDNENKTLDKLYNRLHNNVQTTTRTIK